MKHLLKLSALTPAELTRILDVADQLKAKAGRRRHAPCWRARAWR